MNQPLLVHYGVRTGRPGPLCGQWTGPGFWTTVLTNVTCPHCIVKHAALQAEASERADDDSQKA